MFDNPRDIYNMGLASAYRQTVRKIIPIRVQVAMRAGCSDVRDERGYVTGFVESCTFDIAPMTLVKVAEALRRDPAVAAELRYQYSFAATAVLNLNGTLARAEKSLAAIGARSEVAANTTQ